MRIAVNARLLIKSKLEGMGIFAFESLRRMAAAHPEHEFIYIFDQKADPFFQTSPNITLLKVGFPTRHPILWDLWLKWSLPRALRKIKPDVFFSPDGFIPFDSTFPVLNTIHDLNFEYTADYLPTQAQNFYKKNFPLFAKNATRLVTVSEFSKKTIVDCYHISAEQIDVVFNGGMVDFLPLDEIEKIEIRQRWTSNFPYFLYIGSLNPRKNISGLLAAYELFRQNGGKPIKLVLAGDMRHMENSVSLIRDMKYKEDVIFTGHLSHQNLKELLAAAFALSYVPFFEGFGIPVIEAMQSGVPVITSNCTSLPEVAGTAALLVDPFSTPEIAAALQKLASDDQLRAELIVKGLANAKRFSWDKTAALIWKSIEDVAKKRT